MSRKQIREQIFKILFRIEFHNREDLDEQIFLCLDEADGISDKDAAYIRDKAKHIAEHLDEIDAMVNESAERWKTGRMGKAELAIIRLAVYEMKYEEGIPVSVAINEAVELAKVYGSENGSGFVNGILARLV